MTDPDPTTRDAGADDLVCRSLAIRRVNNAARSVDVIASTDALDTYDESVAQDWSLDRFAANPVVLYNHSRFDSMLPIGHAVARMEGGQLCATLTFVTADANPLAEQVWQSVQQKSLRAVSVGFRSGTVRCEVRDGREVYVREQNDLYEISVVPIPANAEAVMRTRALARRAALVPTTRGAAAPQETAMADATRADQAASQLVRADFFLPIAAELGIAASGDDDARGKLRQLAAEALTVRGAIRVPAGASSADVAARVAELATAASELPKVRAEADALRADKDARDTAERAAHVDALVGATPALASARPALEAFARADYGAFCKSYPRPAGTPRERALTSRMAPVGGATPEPFEAAPATPARHNDQAGLLAQRLMAAAPAKYAGDDGYGRALSDASRQLKTLATGRQ